MYPAPKSGILKAVSRTQLTSMQGENIMSKGQDSKKTDKKAPAKTPKEKKAEKKIKKDEKKK
jgi:hypothetical protein